MFTLTPCSNNTIASLSKAVLEDHHSKGESERALLVEGDLRETIAQFERSAIEDAVAKAGGNKSQASRALGISRFALQRKLEKYDLESGDPPASGEEA